MIKAVYYGPLKFTIAQTKRAGKMVLRELTERSRSGRSASGWTAAMAMNYCEENKWPYRLTAHPGVGYFVERIDEEVAAASGEPPASSRLPRT